VKKEEEVEEEERERGNKLFAIRLCTQKRYGQV